MKKMDKTIVAVNARFLLQGKIEGIGRFSDEVLKRLVRQMPEVEFHFFFDRPWHADFIYSGNVVPHVLYPQARHPFLYMAFFDAAVPFMLNKIGAKLFFSPDGYLSLLSPVPQIGVFHDLAFEHFPEDIGGIHAWHYRNWFPRYARKASHLLTVSEFTRQDVIQLYGIPPEKISVVGNGSPETFYVLPEPERKAVRERYTQGRPYFIYAGAIQPRKNLDTLLRSYDAFRLKSGMDVCLVLTGRKAWNFSEVIQTYDAMQFREDVIFTGYISDAELNALYNGSLALTYISRFEGFGLPILEAMNAGTAVITSNTSSMPEVAGPAAILADPYSVDSISDALLQLATDPELRSRLIAAGMEQKQHFSWDRVAEKCAAVITRTLDSGQQDK